MRRLVSIVLILVLTSHMLAADISLSIYPRFQNGPGTIRVTLVIQRDARNREACVSIEGDTGYSRSSCWEHIGEGARYQTVFFYPDLPPGSYVASAMVVRVVSGKREEVSTPVVEFRLLGVGDEP